MDRMTAQTALADRATPVATLTAIAQEFPDLRAGAAAHPNARLATAQSVRPLIPPPPPRQVSTMSPPIHTPLQVSTAREPMPPPTWQATPARPPVPPPVFV